MKLREIELTTELDSLQFVELIMGFEEAFGCYSAQKLT